MHSTLPPDSAGARPWTVGIDIGGTFTDLVAIHHSTGQRLTAKVLTTPADPLVGVLRSLEDALTQEGVGLSEVGEIVHGTTLATNTLIERKGAKVGLLTTDGFRDVLAMGRADRYDLYDLQIGSQLPLVAPQHCLTVRERIDARGTIVTDLDADSLQDAIQRLAREEVESVAVCFLHSYVNDAHEVAVARTVQEALPGAYVCRSSDIAPVIREYDRFLATAINAYVGPQIASYLGALETELAARGFAGSISIMKSDGGLCAPAVASRYPVRILESGPAAGVISSAYVAAQRGHGLALAFDMGGTTAKAALVVDGQPTFAEEIEVSRLARFNKRSGLPVCLPSIDLIEVGAGGGSIATIGPFGLLQVGPESAEADPGPACYGRGAQRPTVTDADLLLGYLDPDYFAGGTMRLDRDAAARAVAEQILPRTGARSVEDAAWGIRDLVDENMARAARLQCVEHGVDPEAVTLIATGGAGPVHATSVMQKLGARRTICPPDAGVASAFGLIVAPRTAERTVTDVMPLDEEHVPAIAERLARLEADLRWDAAELPPGVRSDYFLHPRLTGQSYTLRIQVSRAPSVQEVAAAYARECMTRFGRSGDIGSLEIVNWTVRLVDERPSPPAFQPAPDSERGETTRRAFLSPDYGWQEVPVLSPTALTPGQPRLGPLLVDAPATTIVVGHGQTIYRDEHLNLVVEQVARSLEDR